MKLRFPARTLVVLALLAAPVLPAAATDNNIEDNLSSYTGQNAEGYLKPLQSALGSSLNSGIVMYGGVPRDGFHARLEFKGMLVSFSDDDKTFNAKTETYFGDEQEVVAPTIVGDTDAVTVTDPSTSASFSFPGGFDIDRFALAVPQVTVGSVMGTEAIGRYIAVETGDAELGDVKLIGFGLRHSVSSYMNDLPVDIAAGFFWQRLEIGSSFLEATALSYGAQVGKAFGIVGAYGGLTLDSIDMDVTYTSDTGAAAADADEIQVEFEKESSLHLTLGATAKLGFLHLNGEFNQADQSSFAVGLGIGN